jgi:YHS domain-containing protein
VDRVIELENPSMPLKTPRLHAIFWSTLLAMLWLAPLPGVAAAKDPVYTGLFSNLAIDGYDTVAYFTEGRPVKGNARYATEYQGAEWRFSSQQNLDAFLADPEAYAPRFGGYCAYAVAQGETASAEPDLWTIHDGRLYLNFSRRVNETWRANREEFIEQANRNWPAVLGN